MHTATSFESKTLDQLEGSSVTSRPDRNSYIEKACFGLRSKPLNEMSIEDVRMLVGQGIGLKFLVPIALRMLSKNPFAEGMHYPGDLLVSVLRVPPQFFAQNPLSREAAEVAYRDAERKLKQLDEIDQRYGAEGIREAWNDFSRRNR